ncbi:MAG TPA: methyltransferase domain-containing protein [Actinomycetota bacterium]|nr:methyltransferase domain-containing protein [Actinomycetota bacterium]
MNASAKNEAAYRARWRAGKRIVRMRPHLWRSLEPKLRDEPILEIGAGLRPTVPPRGSYFADISDEALRVLERLGGKPLDVSTRIPLEDDSLAAVFAFEVLEHVDDDVTLLKEISRTVRTGGLLVCSVPLRMKHWSRLDDLAGHVRRYEPEELFAKIRDARFRLDRLEYRYGHPSEMGDRFATWMLRRLPRFTNLALQRAIFPFQSRMQGWFGKLRWSDPEAPVPASATGVCLVAVRR